MEFQEGMIVPEQWITLRGARCVYVNPKMLGDRLLGLDLGELYIFLYRLKYNGSDELQEVLIQITVLQGPERKPITS